MIYLFILGGVNGSTSHLDASFGFKIEETIILNDDNYMPPIHSHKRSNCEAKEDLECDDNI